MKVKRFIAPNMQAALRQVTQQLGDEAVIISTQRGPKGIEVVAALDYQAERGAGEVQRQLQLQEELEEAKQQLLADQDAVIRETVEAPRNFEALVRPDYVASLSADGKGTSRDPAYTEAIKEMKEELKELKEWFISQSGVGTTAASNPQEYAWSKAQLQEKCFELGLDKKWSEQLIEQVLGDDVEQSWKDMRQMIADTLPISDYKIFEQGGVIAFVGPTGAGKTTTIGKIAAQFVLRHGPESVALLTLDNYRIAAHDQLRTFAKILEVELKVVPINGHLKAELKKLGDKKLILIDTAGLSAKDLCFSTQLEMLKETGLRVKKFLVLPLTSQDRCLQENFQRYKNLGLYGCILTKLDECFSLGGAMSAVVEANVPITLMTNGPHIPHDIHYPNAQKITKLAFRMARANQEWLKTENSPTAQAL